MIQKSDPMYVVCSCTIATYIVTASNMYSKTPRIKPMKDGPSIKLDKGGQVRGSGTTASSWAYHKSSSDSWNLSPSVPLRITQKLLKMAPKKIIIDTDPGWVLPLQYTKSHWRIAFFSVDDILALLLALSASSEDLEVVLISLCFGNIDVERLALGSISACTM